MGTPEVIRSHRIKQRLSQAELAREIGVDVRQINRYETGATEPNLAVARRLADRLHISMDELAGAAPPLNGSWWSAWHSLIPGSDIIITGAVELAQTGRRLSIQADQTQTSHIAWSGEFLTSDDDIVGGYKINTPDYRAIGLLNLVHRNGAIDGDWLRPGLNTVHGKIALAAEHDQAIARVEQVLRTMES